MAIQRPLKTYGTRKYVDEVAAAPNNTDPILASEVDADLDTMYTAFNALVVNATIAATAPAAPVQGQLWWRNDPDGNLYISYNDGNSTQWVPAVPSSAPQWKISGSSLTPVDATKSVAIPGDGAGNVVVVGKPVSKLRLIHHPTAAAAYLTENTALLSASPWWAQDDVTIPSWQLGIDANADKVFFYHMPAGSVVQSTLLTLDNAGKLTIGQLNWSTVNAATGGQGLIGDYGTGGIRIALNDRHGPPAPSVASWNLEMAGAVQFAHRAAGAAAGTSDHYFTLDQAGNFVISGTVGQKASGTTWSNPSDARMKRNVADYGTGLDAITNLRPVSFQYNGAYGTVDDGRTCYGFIAQEVEPVMPECVGEQEWTPRDLAEGETKPAPVTVKTLDQSNMILAVINAVKELATRVAALEAR
jgi:hypothetical protein